jgi:RNA ligase (TIGR02306 family)
MSSFTVPVVQIKDLLPHSNADAIELAVIDGYRTVVKKGKFRPGDCVVYIPQASLLPAYMLKRLGLWDDETGVGRLHGANRDRVTAIRLRGEFSQGICVPTTIDPDDEGRVLVEGASDGVYLSAKVGDDMSTLLGITKWVPEIPAELLGEVFYSDSFLTVAFDLEDVKSYPDLLVEGEEVVMTEKIHGVLTGVSILPHKDRMDFAFGADDNVLLYSKGLGAQGMAFKDVPENSSSIYVRSTEVLRRRIDELALDLDEPLIVVGETFGPGVQDLHYGKELGYRMFAACRGYRGAQKYLDRDALETLAGELGVDCAPVVYRGPFSHAALAEHTSGKTAFGAGHIREGVVTVPAVEREHMSIGRVALKSVSESYHMRKGGTEYS